MEVVNERLPEAALEDITYLSRSDNRLRVLTALTEEPYTRRELAEVTGVSRATLGRIVNEFEDRGWVRRTTDGDYTTTVTGYHMSTQFTPFAESVAAIRRLGEAIDWLPDDELTIGLQHFSTAFVKRPEHDDPMEIIDYFTDRIRGATDMRVLTHLAPPEPCLKAMLDGLVTDRMDGTFVLTADLVEYLGTRSTHRERWQGCVDAGAEVYSYEGNIPCNFILIDDTVFIKSSRPGTVKHSYAEPIVSENATVRSWANEMIDTYRDDSDQRVEIFGDE